MIKYLGAKTRLVAVLGDIFGASGARTAVDLFTGTTRVAQEFKRRSGDVTAVDTARYAEMFARCWIETNAADIDAAELSDALARLSNVVPKPGYFTETFCVQARFVQPHNGARVDAIRDMIEADYKDSGLYPILMTSLILAVDRVDSTVGLQMAFLKHWSERSFRELELRAPRMIEGTGTAVRGDAASLAAKLGRFDFAYLDPPYNQHRYYTNYHMFETLVAWDAPEAYGVARKRVDSRDDVSKSAFNRKRLMPAALRRTMRDINAETVVLSYSDDAWLTLDDLRDMCSHHDHVEVVAFDSKRHVGAQIGVHAPDGTKVGTPTRLRNIEYLVVAGDRERVRHMVDPYLNSEGINWAVRAGQGTLF